MKANFAAITTHPRSSLICCLIVAGGLFTGTPVHGASAAKQGVQMKVTGWETVQPIGNSPGAGTTARRRFTDIWTPQDGSFKLRARQATVVSVN